MVSYQRFMTSILILVLLSLLFITLQAPTVHAQQQVRKRTVAQTTSSQKSLTVRTQSEAIIWLDEVRRGKTDASGVLTITKITPGRHTLRVRARGFRESTVPILPTQRGEIRVRLVRTTDEAELTFQRAEEAREKARDEEARQQVAELYRRALNLRPRFAAAHVGLARVLLDLNDTNAALAEINEARRDRPVYPEASAVEGRILREAAFTNRAIEAFRRSIREARGFQPEAYTGLARIYEDNGRYEESAEAFSVAINQLSDTEPVLYQLLGATYEKLNRYKDALAAYEKYLELAPNGAYAEAIRSIIEQVRQQAAEQESNP